MVAIEERVHPTPFRTRKLSSPSPMILHNVMWESRPLPKIVRDPLAAHSARGSFFMVFHLLAPRRATKDFSRPACVFDRPRYSRGFFCFGGKACGEGNLFGKRFSLPVPHPSKNFYRWACARIKGGYAVHQLRQVFYFVSLWCPVPLHRGTRPLSLRILMRILDGLRLFGSTS